MRDPLSKRKPAPHRPAPDALHTLHTAERAARVDPDGDPWEPTAEWAARSPEHFLRALLWATHGGAEVPDRPEHALPALEAAQRPLTTPTLVGLWERLEADLGAAGREKGSALELQRLRGQLAERSRRA
jgi:hypothetical protein